MPRVKQSDQPPPKTANYETFVNLVTQAYPNLSDRFQQVARFVTQNPNIVAMQSISTRRVSPEGSFSSA